LEPAASARAEEAAKPEAQVEHPARATIIAIELPTAFPYFAAITAILGAADDTPAQLSLLALYNLCFILPLLAVLITLLIAGERADERFIRAREITERCWPEAFAAVLFVLGLVVAGFASAALSGN
jgi:cytochrome c biogenesis protein CcdA